MSRKVYLLVTTRLILNIEEGIETSTVIEEMDYGFRPNPEHGILLDEEIRNFEVQDSK